MIATLKVMVEIDTQDSKYSEMRAWAIKNQIDTQVYDWGDTRFLMTKKEWADFAEAFDLNPGSIIGS